MEHRDSKRSKQSILIVILLVVAICAVSVAVWALFFKNSSPKLSPDYIPQKEEQNAESIPDDTEEKMENPEGGGSVSLTYAKEVTINLSEKKVDLLFINPGKSNQNLALQIIIQDEVVAQSGILMPGNQVTELDLLEGMEQKLSVGMYEGSFLVSYYHPETGERAIVNTEIPISIAVEE